MAETSQFLKNKIEGQKRYEAEHPPQATAPVEESGGLLKNAVDRLADMMRKNSETTPEQQADRALQMAQSPYMPNSAVYRLPGQQTTGTAPAAKSSVQTAQQWAQSPYMPNSGVYKLQGQQSEKPEAPQPIQQVSMPYVEEGWSNQQKYEAAQKAYDDYINTDAYKNYSMQQMVNDAYGALRNSGVSTAPIANVQKSVPKEDAGEKQLRLVRDYYKQQYDAEEDQKLLDADLAEFSKWPQADQDLLIYFQDSRASSAGNIKGQWEAMTALQELNQKYGADKVKQISESVTRKRNAEKTEAEKAQARADVQKYGGTLTSVGTVPAKLYGAVMAPLEYGVQAIEGTGRYKTFDPNGMGNLPNVYADAVRGQVQHNISGDVTDRAGNVVEEGGIVGDALSIGYQGVMSAADSLARAYVGGNPGALALAASGSFGQAVTEASEKGATPAQAIIYGVGTAAIEAATEKIPLDNLLAAAGGSAQGARAIAQEALKQAGIEATTEEISLFGSLLWEAAVLREKSGYKQDIGRAMAQGATYEEAVAMADQAVWGEALNTALVSGVAGAASGGSSAAVGNVFGSGTQTQNQTDQRPVAAPEKAQTAVNAPQATTETKPVTVEQAAAEDVAQQILEKQGAEAGKGIDTENVYYDEAMDLRDEMLAERKTGAGIKGTGAAEENKSVGAMGSQFKHEVKRSAIYDNTYKNSPYADVRLIGKESERQNPNIAQYDVITEKESLHEAELRTETGRDRYSEYRYLMGKDGWTGADNDTAARLLDIYRREKKVELFTALANKRREMGTQAGQMVQSFAKYSRGSATDAATDAVLDLDKLTIDQIDTTFWNPKNEAKTTAEKKNALQKWKKNLSESLLEVADDIDNVADGDVESIKAIVRQLANLRHTTAWAGYSNELTRRTERGLAKMDFETLKTVAKTQLSMIPNDFRKRSIGEIVKQMRMQNMLFTLTTKLKNDTGNISNGLMDAVSDSFGGRMMDAIIGKYTGMRTVANDLRYAAEYRKAAKDAADVAGAFVSLDIPMEADAKYAVGSTRTWSPNRTNTLARLASAFEKHLKYSLEVSDKFYEGGASHVVSRSLQGLGEKSGLTAEQIQDLAQKTGERRTFKDPGAGGVDKNGMPKKGRAGARVASGIQKVLNYLGTDEIGAGDMLLPFAKVAAEVKQVGMDYTGSGLLTGLGEAIGVIKDAKKGKEIDPYRQRLAATNFGRGITGVALTAAFTAMANAGIIKVHNEKDQKERTMDQTQGLSGAQWNLDAAMRWLAALANGASLEEAAQSAAEWKDGDELETLDFLEPFNTQMHIACLIAEGESIPKAFLKGNLDALLEMPMMQTFSDIADITQSFTEVSEGDMSSVLDATGQLIGTVAGSAIPNFARKAAQVIDPYYRDTYDTNPIKKAGKELIAGIPFASKTLPKKYDNLGEEQRRYAEGDGVNAAIDALITPWDTDTYETSEVYLEVERLNEALKSDKINVTPPQPKRKFDYTDKTGVDHNGFVLTEDQYQTMAKTQGQTARDLMERLVNHREYQKLTDEQKAYAINAVYQYAQEQGKKAALPDYYSKAAGWIQSADGRNISDFIVRGTVGPLESAIDKAVADLGNGWAVTAAAKKNIEETYASYSKLGDDAKQKVLEIVEGNVAKYLEVRDKGVSTQNYLDAVDNVQELGKNPKAADEYDAIVSTPNASDSTIDALMKAYMTDYDPNDTSPDKTELKYEYARRQLEMSPKEYVDVYRIYTEGGKKAEMMGKWKGQGYTDAECDVLWKLFKANGDDKIDVISWYEDQNQ